MKNSARASYGTFILVCLLLIVIGVYNDSSFAMPLSIATIGVFAVGFAISLLLVQRKDSTILYAVQVGTYKYLRLPKWKEVYAHSEREATEKVKVAGFCPTGRVVPLIM
jgi:hypothetical membrane protein